MTSREVCPTCERREIRKVFMVRAYIRPGPGEDNKRPYLPVGWYCPICRTFRND